MRKPIFSILLVFLLCGAIPLSCDLFCRDSCGCKAPTPSPGFSIKSMSLESQVQGESGFDPQSHYPHEKYFKSLGVMDHEFSTMLDRGGKGPFFIPLAFACDPVPSRSKQKISAVKITSKKALAVSPSLSILENEDISPLFVWSDHPAAIGVALNDFLAYRSQMFLDVRHYFRFTPIPDGEASLTFDLEVSFDDGTKLYWTDEEMRIK